MMSETCAVCGSSRVRSILETAAVPVFCNQLCRSRSDAVMAPTAPISLGFCDDCGHVRNWTFDESLLAYNPDYENSLHFSGHFQSFASKLVEELVNRYKLQGKRIVEVGCGRGDFLKALCAGGRNRGFGFDMSYPGLGLDSTRSPNVQIEASAYGPEHADIEADFLCCRHVLEHVARPTEFLRTIRETLRPGTPVYVEVPNVLYTLRDGGIWDIIYEHCGYFSPESLRAALELAGFEVTLLREAFDGQFLCAHAKAARNASRRQPEPKRKAPKRKAPGHAKLDAEHERTIPSPELVELVTQFAQQHGLKLGGWRTSLRELSVQGSRVVAWGAGSKGSTFANLVGTEAIPYVVDLNPRKHGMFVAGTGARIVPPEFLSEYRPDVVIVMNPSYEAEIRKQLTTLGLSPEIRLA